MGENGLCEPNVLLGINLNKPSKELDRQVKKVFGHAAAMLESLASAAKIVETIREIYDEYLREHRLNPGFQTYPSPAGLRQEVLRSLSLSPSLLIPPRASSRR